MKTRVQKWGNSLAIRIPRTYADQVRVGVESPVEISVQEGALVVRPLQTSLEDLLEQITEENIHSEAEFGAPVGRERW